MANKFLALALLSATMLVGCATPVQPPVVINSNPTVSTDNVIIPKVSPTALQDIQWQVMNADDMQAYIAANKAQPFVVYVLDQKNIEVEISNIQELRRYLKDQQAAIDYLVGALKLNSGTTAAQPTPDTKKTTP